MMWVLVALVSAASTVFALLRPEWADFVLLTGPVTVAAVLVWLRQRFRARTGATTVVIDGSNVLYWKDNTPRLEAVQDLLRLLKSRGIRPGIFFDANAGYLVADRYLDDRDFARLLGIPARHVVVVPKGTSADQFILRAARDLGTCIVTNDRFRDWADSFPEVAEPGKLIKGGYGDSGIFLRQFAPSEAGA
ncbi:NYN domain-containing protein [Thalassovita sp.]|uniref:NYN domain-containing protein n=1 Tax=Thalassovita sp. TaxID=1979401 RepID=UPI0029DE9025|nr:hypothetical protein [Thalassovita sp.]